MVQGREMGEVSSHRNRRRSTSGSARCRSRFCVAWSPGEVENGGELKRGERASYRHDAGMKRVGINRN
jgi:hypothetical protein